MSLYDCITKNPLVAMYGGSEDSCGRRFLALQPDRIFYVQDAS